MNVERRRAPPGKDSAEADLIKAVHAVAGGKSFFSPAVSKVLLDDYVRKLRRSGMTKRISRCSPTKRATASS